MDTVTVTAIDIETIAAAYIEAALWADCTPACDCEPGWCDCESGDLRHLDVHDDSRAYILRLVTLFVEQHTDDCLAYVEQLGDEQLGHDLRLSSGGHGCGLGDRSAGAVGERLHAASQQRPYCRVDGGDLWQVDDETATFDHRPLGR